MSESGSITRASSLRPAEAVFVSALPYRQSVYRTGGFQQNDGPRSVAHWLDFLRTHFSSRDLARAEREAAAYRKMDTRQADSDRNSRQISYVTIWDDFYPRVLREIYDAPPVLFFSGADFPAIVSDPADAVVGTRSPHPLCEAAVWHYVDQLASCRNARPVIISGFARGIDRIAHLAAIHYNLPGIAVLGAGLYHAGPRSNLDILRAAAARQIPFALVSEFPPHTIGRAANFPRRNRIIAGLAGSVAVVQAPARSGAMITARLALHEGRDVLAFDHSILSEATGSNDGARGLLEDGAIPIRVPELEARIVTEPPYSRTSPETWLRLWKSAVLGGDLRWLGGRYYLKSRISSPAGPDSGRILP